MAKKRKSNTVDDVLSKDWLGFNRSLARLDESQLARALEAELAGKNRPSYIERIHTRFNSVRVEREKRELAEKVVV